VIQRGKIAHAQNSSHAWPAQKIARCVPRDGPTGSTSLPIVCRGPNVKNVPEIAPAIGQLLPAIDQPRQPRQTCMLVQATDRVRWQAQLCHLLNFLEKAVHMYQLRKVSTRGSRVIERSRVRGVFQCKKSQKKTPPWRDLWVSTIPVGVNTGRHPRFS
jgi:hypothetical protein